MFYTRNTLHIRAYKHKTTKMIEKMYVYLYMCSISILTTKICTIVPIKFMYALSHWLWFQVSQIWLGVLRLKTIAYRHDTITILDILLHSRSRMHCPFQGCINTPHSSYWLLQYQIQRPVISKLNLMILLFCNNFSMRGCIYVCMYGYI